VNQILQGLTNMQVLLTISTLFPVVLSMF